MRAGISLTDKLRGMWELKRPLVNRDPDDPVVVLFTSGSEGTPKGVVLSNRNMLANVAQAEARIDFGRRDTLFNVLPLFHSFGLTVGLILPLCTGVRVYLYPSPLHYRIVPEMVYGTNATIMFGTDTFLSATRVRPILTISARCAICSPAQSLCVTRPDGRIWKSSACASSKAMA